MFRPLGALTWNSEKQFQLFSDTFTNNLPLADRAEAYCHSGFVIWSQSTLFGDTHQDLRDVLGGCAAPLHSHQQGGVCALLEVCSLHSHQKSKPCLISIPIQYNWPPTHLQTKPPTFPAYPSYSLIVIFKWYILVYVCNCTCPPPKLITLTAMFLLSINLSVPNHDLD